MRKIIVVTGASSGMGAHFARILSAEEECDSLWIAARREDRLRELKAQIEADGRRRAKEVRAICVDLSGSGGALRMRELFEQEEERGPFVISVLVNNAGFGTYGEFASTDAMREMRMIDLNCTSLTGITSFALPRMERGSRIINVASLAAFAPLGNFAVYAATKSYVLNFSIALAKELAGRGIKVTAACPGSVSTEFALVASRGARKEVLHGKSAEKTARDAIKKSRKGRLISMWAPKWKLCAALCRIFSPPLIAWATCKFSKRPSN